MSHAPESPSEAGRTPPDKTATPPGALALAAGWTMWAYIAPNGQILPSTIRERPGDSKAALRDIYWPARVYRATDCRQARVSIQLADLSNASDEPRA